MKHLFILNAYAGKKSRVDEFKEKISQLELDGECFVEVTSAHGDATKIARKYAENNDDFLRVYACGGDGTANEAMSGLVGFDNCALGVIPAGTGNDFVKSFDFPKEDFLDLEKMTKGDTVKIDLLKCGDNYAMNTISVGYDCAVAKYAQKIKRFPLMTGPTAYKVALVYCLFSKRKHTFVPFAELCDGNIDFLSIPTVSLLQFAKLLGVFIKGEHIGHKNAQFIVHKKCKEMQFKNDTPIDIGLDGEIFNMKDPVITVKPEALSVIIPGKKEKTTEQGILCHSEGV